MERNLYVNLKDRMSNSEDPDEMAHFEPSYLDLRCLQKPITITAYGSERVNDIETYCEYGINAAEDVLF